MRDSNQVWQKILAQGFSCARDLLTYLQLPVEMASSAADRQFKTRVPIGFAARMEPKNPRDPLLLQVLATDDELVRLPEYNEDPLAELAANPRRGLIHKYYGRVLLTVTGACAINCRYCFRRHFPYKNNNPGRLGWQSTINYIAADPTIREVILSGGDPLLATDEVISSLLSQLTAINHLTTVRIHTRIPVVLPERITTNLLELFAELPLKKVMVVHSNHSHELDDQFARIATDLKKAGFYLLNQSVLLRNVNDNPRTLAALSERLFSCGVLPYYLHVLDKVHGAGHFDIPTEQAKSIYTELQTYLPGYLVPRLVREEPGKKNKTLIST
ncbi:MAG: EF-P beta-lysylation protein EpmB [Legionella sp.]